MVIGVAIAAGHKAGAPERAFFAAGNAHAEEADAGRLQRGDPAFGVGEERIAAVDDDVAGFEKRLEFVDHHVNRLARLDHDENSPRLFQTQDKVLWGFKSLGVSALGDFVDEVFGLGIRAIIDGDGEAVSLDVHCDVSTHHFQPDNPECLTGHMKSFHCFRRRSFVNV